MTDRKPKYKTTTDSESGILEVTVLEAKNLSGRSKGGSAPYCSIKNTFNKQNFKTKTAKKASSPSWNQTFKFFTKKLDGNVMIKLYEKGRFISEDSLGEVSIPINKLANGEPQEEWFQLTNEPKKHKNSAKGTQQGEIKLRLYYPNGKKSEEATKDLKLETKERSQSKSGKPESKPKRTAKEVYTFGKELGKGGFSVVKECVNKETGEKVAIKIIEKQNAGEEELQLLQREIDIMEKLTHKNIISLVETFDEPEHIYLVLELVTGGELFDQILARGSYGERDAANIVKQILLAIQYMHSNGVAHRDLKPENLLCSGKNGEIIKVTDFGLSKDFGQDKLKTSCGTPDYVAPEVLKGQAYDSSVDIWSIGVISYILSGLFFFSFF
eukprot:TRINITY_DN986_c0_g1_i2.p1 TRINITY_DN986_c0_g1~~TRINITY_DN986_c0_g1_i2.p1  ORF type:complete len:383 (-),score=83.69 TRINITY_DN986_c0_g1_i2:452-1600(-)